MDECDGPEWSPDVWNQNGSESEGFGFNLCVVPSGVVSLISEDGGWIGDRRLGDDFIKDGSQTRVTRRGIQVIEQEEDLRDKCSERTMLKISWDSN